MIEKDPSSFGKLLIETVNHIILTATEELYAIDPLQLPYLKYVLTKAQSFGVYYIDEDFIKKLDELINQNKYAYSFKELETSLTSDAKHDDTHFFYSLMSKDQIEKRLNFMYMNEKILQKKMDEKLTPINDELIRS